MSLTITGPLSISNISIFTESAIYVAIAQGSDAAAYSSDGITWNSTTLPSSQSWNSVAYGNELFVAISGANPSTNSDVFAYSTDGVNWTQGTLPSSQRWLSIAYGAGLFVALASGTVSATSPNGVDWTQRTIPNATWTKIVFANGRFVAVSGYINSNAAMTSTDGINWTNPSSGGALNNARPWTGLAYGGGTWVAVASGGITPRNNYSTDAAANWSAGGLDNSYAWNTIAYGYSAPYSNNIFVALGQNSLAQSVAGQSTWDQTSLTGAWTSVIYRDGLFVAVASGGTAAATSPDGIVWTARTLPTSANWISLATNL